MVTLKPGDMAPDFTLPTHNEGELNLAWYRGRKNVVLAFYPADFTPVCATQIPLYEEVIDKFEECQCQLLCISCDAIPSHIAWAKALGGLSFPIMSDFWPHGEVARKYGVLSKKGYTERFVFLIDKKGVIRYIEDVGLSSLPNNDELFNRLENLKRSQKEVRDG